MPLLTIEISEEQRRWLMKGGRSLNHHRFPAGVPKPRWSPARVLTEFLRTEESILGWAMNHDGGDTVHDFAEARRQLVAMQQRRRAGHQVRYTARDIRRWIAGLDRALDRARTVRRAEAARRRREASL